MPKTHLLCYIRRDELTAWKLDSLSRSPDYPVPAYGSSHPIFEQYAQKGNTVWAIGVYPDGPPTLEARIEIAKVIPSKEHQYRCDVEGTREGSTFFGVNDASRALMQLVFQNAAGCWSLRDDGSREWRRALGKKFQGPRRIAPKGKYEDGHSSPGAAPLEALADIVSKRSVFVSYKHRDHTTAQRRFIRALSIELAKRRFAVWWDEMALTNVEAIKDDALKRRKRKLMRRLLQQGLGASKAILALWTENYGTKSGRDNWTREEWESPGPVRFVLPTVEDQERPELCGPYKTLSMRVKRGPSDAVSVAREFERLYASSCR